MTVNELGFVRSWKIVSTLIHLLGLDYFKREPETSYVFYILWNFLVGFIVLISSTVIKTSDKLILSIGNNGKNTLL